MPDDHSLPSLLSKALEGIVAVYLDKGAGLGTQPSLEMWSNLLRALNDKGVVKRALPERLCLSRRAMRSYLALACRRGWAEELRGGRDQAAVRLTRDGGAVARHWPGLRKAAERTWEERVGRGVLERVHEPLAVLVSRLPLEYPHYPASYGMADARVTGGYGQDWKPVHRGKGDTTSSLPLSALLSEALMGFAHAYEDRAEVALCPARRVLTRLPPEGRDARSLNIRGGWLSAMVRHGVLSAEERGDTVQITLTEVGRGLAEAHEDNVQAVEQQWSTDFGAEVVGSVREALEGIGATAQTGVRASVEAGR